MPSTPSPPCSVVIVPATDPRLEKLFVKAEEYYGSLYSAADNAAFNSVDLSTAPLCFIARSNNQPLGCVILRPDDHASAEIKRLFVAPEARGRGIGRMLIECLIDEARSRDVDILKLETGVVQADAVRLYEKMGFIPCARFGDYPAHSLSVFMALDLTNRRPRPPPSHGGSEPSSVNRAA